MEIDAVLGKNEKRYYFYAASTIRKAREEAVGDRLIALVILSMFVCPTAIQVVSNKFTKLQKQRSKEITVVKSTQTCIKPSCIYRPN